MLLLGCSILFQFGEEVAGHFFPSFLSHFTWQLLSTFEITCFFSPLSLSLCVPLNSLLPTSPGVHQATVRGGAETVRDLAAAATAWTSSTSGNGKAGSQLTCSVFIRCVHVCVCVCVLLMCQSRRGDPSTYGPRKSHRNFIHFLTQFSKSQYI